MALNILNVIIAKTRCVFKEMPATSIADNVVKVLAESHALEGDDAGEIESKTLTISTEMIEAVRRHCSIGRSGPLCCQML